MNHSFYLLNDIHKLVEITLNLFKYDTTRHTDMKQKYGIVIRDIQNVGKREEYKNKGVVPK